MDFIYQQNTQLLLDAADQKQAVIADSAELTRQQALHINALVAEVLNAPDGCQEQVDQLPLNLRIDLLNQLGALCDPRIQPLNPKMIKISAGSFSLGLPAEQLDQAMKEMEKIGIDRAWIDKETPRYTVTLPDYALGRYLVTNAE